MSNPTERERNASGVRKKYHQHNIARNDIERNIAGNNIARNNIAILEYCRSNCLSFLVSEYHVLISPGHRAPMVVNIVYLT